MLRVLHPVEGARQQSYGHQLISDFRQNGIQTRFLCWELLGEKVQQQETKQERKDRDPGHPVLPIQ